MYIVSILYCSRDVSSDVLTCIAVEVNNSDCFTALIGKWIVQNISKNWGDDTERTQNQNLEFDDNL
jgi:hypothetical protein